MKKFITILKKIRREFLIAGVIALSISAISSLITYKVVMHQVPKIAVVDLAYLNNDFILNLSRYRIEKKSSDQEIEEMVKSYSANLEIMLDDISQSGNYLLLQKQMVVSQNVHNLTPDLEKALFESVISNVKNH